MKLEDFDQDHDKVIQGNYPDTYKAELRSWGFQKEKY
jgi:hypothetical protein